LTSSALKDAQKTEKASDRDKRDKIDRDYGESRHDRKKTYFEKPVEEVRLPTFCTAVEKSICCAYERNFLINAIQFSNVVGVVFSSTSIHLIGACHFLFVRVNSYSDFQYLISSSYVNLL
jgi:hypothetical protein